MYGRLIMAGTTLMGARAAGQMTSTSLNALLKPRSLSLLGAICASDAVYMLSLNKAVALISPVYVSAIKRGGGVMVSSLIGSKSRVLLLGQVRQFMDRAITSRFRQPAAVRSPAVRIEAPDPNTPAALSPSSPLQRAGERPRDPDPHHRSWRGAAMHEVSRRQEYWGVKTPSTQRTFLEATAARWKAAS